MKDGTKKKLCRLIYSIMVYLTISLKGEQQKKAMVIYFLEFIHKDDDLNHNKYKALSKNRISSKDSFVFKSRNILINELLLHKNRNAKDKSLNRITLIVDDSCDGKKYSKKSKKLHKNLDHSLKNKVFTHNLVVLAFTVGMGRYCRKYILDFRVWQKGGKKKHELFIEMITDLLFSLKKNGCNLNDLVITFDSGYSYDSVLEKLDKLSLLFVGKYHHRKNKIIEGKKQCLTDFLKTKFRASSFLKVADVYRKRISCKYYKKLKIEDSPWNFILCLFERKNKKRRPRVLLVSNMKKPYYCVIERYSQRYYIEHIFRDLKQLFGFNVFHKNDKMNKFTEHVCICIIRYDFIQDFKTENRMTKLTNGQAIRRIRKWLLEMSKMDRDIWFSSFVEKENEFHKFF
jgi:hypothetical protein